VQKEAQCRKRTVDKCGESHYLLTMNTATLKPSTAADARNRVSLRGAKAKYFYVKEFSNGIRFTT
jgi:hypothetical protein